MLNWFSLYLLHGWMINHHCQQSLILSTLGCPISMFQPYFQPCFYIIPHFFNGIILNSSCLFSLVHFRCLIVYQSPSFLVPWTCETFYMSCDGCFVPSLEYEHGGVISTMLEIFNEWCFSGTFLLKDRESSCQIFSIFTPRTIGVGM